MSTEIPPDRAGSKPPLALIAGPTASGKSDLAVELAVRIETTGKRAVVINADSAQVYADLAVLSARPSQGDMRGIEHRLFGEWDGALPCSAADWAQRAKNEVALCLAEGAMPILVGGTGLYLRTLLDGIAPVPPIDPAIRATVRTLPVSEAHAALQTEDREGAAKLAPADAARIMRALEVVRSTGETLAYWQQRREGGIGSEVSLNAAVLLPDREKLYARCDKRFATMLDPSTASGGAVAEVEALLARNLDPALPVMRAIGVREIAGYLRGDWSLAEAEAMGAQATRNYAKRQYTWFRRQPPIDWSRVEYDNFSIGPICDIIYQHFLLT
jgi:tRNA dimethylallyltransferase